LKNDEHSPVRIEAAPLIYEKVTIDDACFNLLLETRQRTNPELAFGECLLLHAAILFPGWLILCDISDFGL
jgi:hypothetical protein